MIKKSRIEVVDVLRGFAIMAIILLHSIERFNFYSFPDPSLQADWLNSLDKGVWESLFFLFGGKAYAIFSLLFGFTFSLMFSKQASHGKDFRLRFLWRMLLLASFALINGLFFPGEVLMMYAILGSLLIFISGFKMHYLILTAAFFVLQPVELNRIIQILIDSNYEPVQLAQNYTWQAVGEGQAGDSFWRLIKANTQYGHVLALKWAWGVGRLSQTFGLFIIGCWLGRSNKFINTDSNIKFWKYVLIIALVLFAGLYVMVQNASLFSEHELMQKTIKTMLNMYSNLAFTGILFSGIILLYYKTSLRKILLRLQYPGRMSLTAYITQSIMGGFIFYGYGLGLASKVGHTLAFIIGIGLFLIQYYFCRWWIKRFNNGPFEKIWHRLTWINKK